MKKLVKSFLIAIPALMVAATVGLAGCGDEAGEPDLAVKPDQGVAHDLSHKD